jgi:hypothetical protein
MSKSSKFINSQVIQSLANAVPLGQYRCLSASTQLPSGISWGGSDCKCIVIAASSYNGSTIPNLPSQMIPSGNIYLVREFRSGPEGSPPHKVDDCLYYTNNEGTPWRVHSKESPDHHTGIMSASSFAEIAHEFNLPPASSGTLAEYRSAGAHLDFEQPFWKMTDASSRDPKS